MSGVVLGRGRGEQGDMIENKIDRENERESK